MSEHDEALTSAPNFEPPLRERDGHGRQLAPRSPSGAARVRHGPEDRSPEGGSPVPGGHAHGGRHVEPSPGRRVPCRTVPTRRAPGQRALPPATVGEAHYASRKFAERALRIVLEVLDHRRPVGHLASVAHPSVVAALRTLVGGGDLVPARELGVAVLAKVDIAMVDAASAEVYARYHRGRRHFAVAARITCTRADGWRLTALRVS